MYQIQVEPKPYQELFFNFHNNRLKLILRYNSIAMCWVMDAYDENKQKYVAQGLSLIVDSPMMWRSPTDYFFLLMDSDKKNEDLWQQEDLGSRYLLYVGLKSEVI